MSLSTIWNVFRCSIGGSAFSSCSLGAVRVVVGLFCPRDFLASAAEPEDFGFSVSEFE
ncbi:MAG: hypothetical protein IPJ71_16900 [Bdellovibrionales bacterium]|nr:hypothetical protein [Bdellovibrionales bacterium]